ncbi:hypothetical protein SDC9_145038 [bioreactor metagenome]|uniref:Uncharacterized protein n=1 Tax=bioreactor metagenome TaxID=1076179 RepID=A0A645E9P9_9ZZZZ
MEIMIVDHHRGHHYIFSFISRILIQHIVQLLHKEEGNNQQSKRNNILQKQEKLPGNDRYATHID